MCKIYLKCKDEVTEDMGLTLHRVYELVEEIEGYVVIQNDWGVEYCYSPSRFDVVGSIDNLL